MKKGIKNFATILSIAFMSISCCNNCEKGENACNKNEANTKEASNAAVSTDKKDEIIVEKFVNDDGKTLTASYNTTNSPTVTIDFEGYKNEVLTQITAWAKGAEYENTNMKWRASSQEYELIINGKSIKFKPLKK